MLLFLMMSTVVGGIIGGGTNRLAIAMLFRPYHAVQIGSWQLPLTPGLIPKRRQELAYQLGRTVREYLINGEAIRRVTGSANAKEQLTKWLAREWEACKAQHRVKQWVLSLLEQEEASLDLEQEMCLGDLVTSEWRLEIEQLGTEWAPQLNRALIRFLTSEEGSLALQGIYSEWTRSRGWVGKVTSTLFDERRAAEKGQEWLVQALASPQGLTLTRALLTHGTEALYELKVRDVVAWWTRHTAAPSAVRTETIHRLLERTVPYILQTIGARAEELLELLQLDRLVREQVETFSLPMLEEMIVQVARRELRMITWIGVLIGSFIGLLQGVFVSLFR